jgi:high-affinity Fe2+/Pb2+ permease
MKGTAIGFFQFVTGLVNIGGGIVAGLFWNLSPQSMFIYISIVAFLSIILLAFVREK